MSIVPPIAILGAGPAGLALARLLSLASIDYIVYERDVSAGSASYRGASGTLDLHANTAQLALRKAGLYDEFKKRARFDVPTVMADKQGRVVARLQGEGDTDRPEIDRRDLREMLLQSVPVAKVVWGAKVEGVEREEDGLMGVRFSDGRSVSGFRLVVGADGAWSKARAMVGNLYLQHCTHGLMWHGSVPRRNRSTPASSTSPRRSSLRTHFTPLLPR